MHVPYCCRNCFHVVVESRAEGASVLCVPSLLIVCRFSISPKPPVPLPKNHLIKRQHLPFLPQRMTAHGLLFSTYSYSYSYTKTSKVNGMMHRVLYGTRYLVRI